MADEVEQQTWTLRLRFRVAPDRVIIEGDVSEAIGSLKYSLGRVRTAGTGRMVLRREISGFTSEAAARSYVENMRVAFAWLLLGSTNVAADATFDIQEIRPIRDLGGLPIEIDGRRPAVYPTGARLTVATGYPPQLRLGLPASAALAALIEGVRFPGLGRFAQENSLAVALDLYRAHFTEPSAPVRSSRSSRLWRRSQPASGRLPSRERWSD